MATRFAITIPQAVLDGAFDPAAFRAHLERAEALGFESAWTAEQVLGTMPFLGPIAKRVYLGIDDDAERRPPARRRRPVRALRLHRCEGPEPAAVCGPPDALVKGLREVVDAGAALILLDPLFEGAEQMERLATEVVPQLD